MRAGKVICNKRLFLDADRNFNLNAEIRCTPECGVSYGGHAYDGAMFDPSDPEIHVGCLKINKFVCFIEKVMGTKIEVNRPYSFGENYQKLINDLRPF